MKYALKLSTEFSPIGKLKIIDKINENIIKSMKEYYHNFSMELVPFIDNKDMVGIFAFIYCKCELAEISIHLEIIKKFSRFCFIKSKNENSI